MIETIKGGSALEIVNQPKKMSKVHQEILDLYPGIESDVSAFCRTVVNNTITNQQLNERIDYLRAKKGPKNTRELEIALKLRDLRIKKEVLPSPRESQGVSGPAILL